MRLSTNNRLAFASATVIHINMHIAIFLSFYVCFCCKYHAAHHTFFGMYTVGKQKVKRFHPIVYLRERTAQTLVAQSGQFFD